MNTYNDIILNLHKKTNNLFNELFENKYRFVIAGGFILACADKKQNIDEYKGDIDFYFPEKTPQERIYYFNILLHKILDILKKNNIQYKIKIRYSVLYIENDLIDINLISGNFKNIDDIFKTFDLDICQIALSDNMLLQYCTLFEEKLKTRIVYAKQIRDDRYIKYFNKGFLIITKDIIKYTMKVEYTTVNIDDIKNELKNKFIYDSKFTNNLSIQDLVNTDYPCLNKGNMKNVDVELYNDNPQFLGNITIDNKKIIIENKNNLQEIKPNEKECLISYENFWNDELIMQCIQCNACYKEQNLLTFNNGVCCPYCRQYSGFITGLCKLE